MSETDSADEESENWFQMLQATAARFEEENDDLEAILEGDIGFHAYFAGTEDPTRGTQTAIYQGIYEAIEEVSLDADVVEINHGEVTPETVWAELENQLHEHVYLPEGFQKPIERRVKERVEKNLEKQGESA